MLDDVSTICTCVRITRTDGTVIGITSLDDDITIGCVTYVAGSGYEPTSIKETAKLNVNNADIQGLIKAGLIDESDVINGTYDNAVLYVFMYDYTTNQEVGRSVKGVWGQLRLVGDKYTAEFRSLSQLLQNPTGRVIAAQCDAALGDTRCGADIDQYKKTGTVTSYSRSEPDIIGVSFDLDNDDATHLGYVLFTSGANAGIYKDAVVIYTNDDEIKMDSRPVHPITVGDGVLYVQECDKSKETCGEYFDNLVNFRGFPSIPSALDTYGVSIGECGG